MYKKDKAKNDKVVRAIAFGLAAVMAATPVMDATTVYAGEAITEETVADENVTEQAEEIGAQTEAEDNVDAMNTEIASEPVAVMTLGQETTDLEVDETVGEEVYAEAKAVYEEAAVAYEAAKMEANEAGNDAEAKDAVVQIGIEAYQAAVDAYDAANSAYEAAKDTESEDKVAELKEIAEEAKENANQWAAELSGDDSALVQAKESLSQATKDFQDSVANVKDDITGEEGIVKTGVALAKADEALAVAVVAEVQAAGDVAAKAAALAELEVKKLAAETALNLAKSAIDKDSEITAEMKASLDAAETALEETQRIYDEAHDALYGKVDEDGNVIVKGAIQTEEDARLAEEAAEQKKAEVEAFEKSELGKEYARLENEIADANKELAELPEDADEETMAAAQAKVDEAKQNLVITAITYEITKDGENEDEQISVSTVEVVGTDIDNNNSTVYKVTFADGSEVYYQSVENENNTISLYDYNFTKQSNVAGSKTGISEDAKNAYIDAIVREDGTKGQAGVDYVVENTVEHEDAEYTVVQNTAEMVISNLNQNELKSLYGHIADNVEHYVVIDGTEYRAIISKKKVVLVDVYELLYINENGEETSLNLSQNTNGVSVKEITTTVNVKESDLANYNNIVGDPVKTKEEVAAEYNVTYYDVVRTEEGKNASEISDSINDGNGLTEEQIETLAKGEAIATPEYKIVQNTPAEDAEYKYTYDVEWTENYTEDENTTVANLGNATYAGKTVQTATGEKVSYNESTGKYEYTKAIETTKYYYLDIRGNRHYNDSQSWKYPLIETTTTYETRVLGDADSVKVLSVDKTRDMNATLSKEDYDKAVSEGTEFSSVNENAECIKEAVAATYNVIYYNARDRYSEIDGTEGDGSYTDMATRKSNAEDAVSKAKNDHSEAVKLLVNAKAEEVKDGANLALKKADYEVKKGLYDAANELNQKMQSAYDEKKAEYDAYYVKRKSDDDNILELASSGSKVVVQLVKAGFTKDEAEDILKAIKTGDMTAIGGEVVIKIVDSGAYDNDFLTQFEKDALVATANLAKSSKNLAEAKQNLKDSAEAWTNAAEAHGESFANLASSLGDVVKATGSVISGAVNVGVESIKLAVSQITLDFENMEVVVTPTDK